MAPENENKTTAEAAAEMAASSTPDIASKSAVATDEQLPPVRTEGVAVPEIRTGKVDLEGDFHKSQNTDGKPGITFDTVAVPEVHTGKCPDWDPNCEEEKPKKKHGFFSSLAHTIMDGEATE